MTRQIEFISYRANRQTGNTHPFHHHFTSSWLKIYHKSTNKTDFINVIFTKSRKCRLKNQIKPSKCKIHCAIQRAMQVLFQTSLPHSRSDERISSSEMGDNSHSTKGLDYVGRILIRLVTPRAKTHHDKQ